MGKVEHHLPATDKVATSRFPLSNDRLTLRMVLRILRSSNSPHPSARLGYRVSLFPATDLSSEYADAARARRRHRRRRWK